MKKTLLVALAILVGIITIVGIITVCSIQKYHDENTFADIRVVTKDRALDPYEENYNIKTFSNTCIKGSVVVLEPEDYKVTILNVEHDGQVDFKVSARGGLCADGVEYGPEDVITLREGETITLDEEVMDAEFVIEIEITNVYYR